ncbi:MAG: glutamate-5-semialdehyde dehydrogenase [Dehalococcoidia bacterium]|nr:glutamate-5-semialdehyde dehydrogenase [Dehalococcoidia bacterium]
MQPETNELVRKCAAARTAAKRMASLPTEVKNAALLNIAADLEARQESVLAANKLDYAEAECAGMDPAMLDRLMLSPERLRGIAGDVRAVAALPDPVGEVFDMRTLPNGLTLGRRRVPLGVIGAVYESRPNVTIDISALCLKSGNAVILRGGREAVRSNLALAGLVQGAVARAGVPEGAVQAVESTDRSLVGDMLKMKGQIDLVIPRGGVELINFVRDNATMPVVTGGVGVCHVYVDVTANIDNAVAIVFNAKVQRPTVCNALDCVLVHPDVAPRFLPAMARELARAKVELRCDLRSMSILCLQSGLNVVAAQDSDWGKEFLALVLAVKIVDSLDDAMAHIEKYGSGHSEALLTEDYTSSQRFVNEVDAACVYVNASTRFTDGAQFGLGAEVGISTQKFHARGPMGLKELTSYKWIIYGSGQIRK